MRKMLLHTCCAPCLSGANKALSAADLCMTGYFYNPNIHPREELLKRIVALKKYSAAQRFNTVIIDNYDIGLFKKEAVDKAGDRCRKCYSLRLDAAAGFAKKNKYDCFSTTLLLSPYQKHDIIKSAGEEAAGKHGIDFYYSDFRPFYAESVRISREMGLYRQRYCGCYISREIKDEQVSVVTR